MAEEDFFALLEQLAGMGVNPMTYPRGDDLMRMLLAVEQPVGVPQTLPSYSWQTPSIPMEQLLTLGRTSASQAIGTGSGIDLGSGKQARKKSKGQNRLRPTSGAGVAGYTGGGPAEAALMQQWGPNGGNYGLPIPKFTDPNRATEFAAMQQSNPLLGPIFQAMGIFGPDYQQAIAAQQAAGSPAGNAAAAAAQAQAQAQARAAALGAAYRRQMASLGTTIDAATATGTQAADAALSAVRANPSPYQNIQLSQAQDATNPLANYMRQLGTSTQQADATLGLLNQMNQTQNAGLSQLATNLGTINQNAQNGMVNDIERSKQAFIQQLAQQRAAEELALKNYYGSRGVRV